MTTLRQLQKDFLDYLLAIDDNISARVVEQGELDRLARLDIYKNAYKVRLRKCIENDHEILWTYLGDELFEQLAEGYINTFPSTYTSLRNYCDRIPEYLEQHQPFNLVPVLSEIAAFERIMMSAFDAEDINHTRPNACMLQNIDSDNWPYIRFQFHPSARLFEANMNSVQIWHQLKINEPPPEAMLLQSYWLTWRGEDNITQYKKICIEERLMFKHFANGFMFADVCDSLLDHFNDDEAVPFVVQCLMDWLESGLIQNISFE